MDMRYWSKESGKDLCKVDFTLLGTEHCIFYINYLYRSGNSETELAKGYKEKFIELIERKLTK